MRRALFLDRDGVINVDGHYIHRPEEFHFVDGIFELCRAAADKDYLLIVVTNQSGIARGMYSEADFLKLTDWMRARFREEGVLISEVYFCPYHPKDGIGAYRQDSYDRKPHPGRILKAKDEFDIDLSRSIIIGDKDSDMEAGRRAQVGKLCLLAGEYPYQTAEDVTVLDSLQAGVSILLGGV